MKALIQRVLNASVSIEGRIHSEIGQGMLVLFCVETSDSRDYIDWMVRKIVNMRIFDDEEGVMNRSIQDIGGEVLVVSQFTLAANVKKGNRPSYVDAARPEKAVPIYEEFCQALSRASGREVKTGVFGADMKVALVNDGPVTIPLSLGGKDGEDR